MNVIKNIMGGIAILIAIYLILSKGDSVITLFNNITQGVNNAVLTLQGG